MASLVWTSPAKQDVDDIYDFIARRDRRPETAEKVVRELVLHCESYAEAFAAGNSIGTLRPSLGENVWVFTHKRWVIGFRPIQDGIEVLRVVDGARDFSRLFA